jgi:hypothetical protein
MAELSKKIILKKSRLLLDVTKFDIVGSGHISELRQQQLTESTYPIRHVIVKGNFNLSFPNTDIQSASGGVGTIWPHQDYSSNVFQITSETENAIYYCVLPSKNETIVKNEISLSTGESATISVTQLGFVFGQKFMVNSNTRSNVAVVSCENNPAVIVATQPCNLIILQSSYFTT